MGDTARERDGTTGEAAREGVGEDEGLTGRASKDDRRPEREEEVDARGRCDDDDAEGIARCVVGVREDDRACIGLVARGVEGGEPRPRGRWLALAAALLELTPIPRGDGELGAVGSGDLVCSLDRRVGVSGGGEREASSRLEEERAACDEVASDSGGGRPFVRCSRSLGDGEDVPFARVSRLGARGVGPLMSLVLTAGWALALRIRSRGGDIRAATLEVDPLGSAKGWVKGEGMGCADRCNAGEDMEACRNEGVKKLVWPATRTLSLSRSLLPRAASFSSRAREGTGGTGEGEDTSLPGRRNETLDNIRDLAFSFSLGPSPSEAFPLPFPAP